MFTLPELPYEYNALEPYIDEETMRIHHNKHHGAYVSNLNEALKDYPELQNKTAEELLQNLNQIPETIRTKVRNNAGGHVNHSLFWQIMAPAEKGGGVMPKGKLLEAIDKVFGSFDSFKERFTAAGMGRFGSGWAWLVVSEGKLEILDTPNQDNPLIEAKGVPILGLDVWEHAYYLKYQNRRGDYITAWWNVVNWGKIEERFEKETSSPPKP
jgi:Fe-Mn family superoxide dismutase